MYDKLGAGLHFMAGDRVLKSLSLTNADEWQNVLGFGDGRTQTPEQLLNAVSWVYIALDKRREQALEIDRQWQRNGEEATPVFKVDTGDMLQRVDTAMQLYGAAYMLKQRAGNRFIGLRWVDPTAIEPDPHTLTADGYQAYIYQTSRGRVPIMATDVIRFMAPGMREHDPFPAAGSVTSLAAQIIHGMEETADTFYDTNGLPVVVVIVPQQTQPGDLERIQSRFERIFRRKRSLDGNKTIGLRQGPNGTGVDVKPISFAPKDLAMSELEQSKIDSILLGHGVPPAIVHRDVNLAEAIEKKRQFVGTIGARCNAIADTLNMDDDIARSGYELRFFVDQHWTMRRDEATVSLAATRYATLMKPEAALWMMGIKEEDFPEEMQGNIFYDMPVQAPTMSEAGGMEMPDDEGEAEAEPVRSAAWMLDAKAFKKWYKNRYNNRDTIELEDFKSNELTLLDKFALSDEVITKTQKEVTTGQDAPFQGYP